jgi:nucleolar pre-ribosomal-associated protein 1
MREKSLVMYILKLLKNCIPPPTGRFPARLPTPATLILLHALRGVFYPSNFIFPLSARFLLQRPELDTRDVPMLYGMLYSSSENWRKERLWILRSLADGMVSSDDWKVLKRRHTWDLLATLFQSVDNDRTTRAHILEVKRPYAD